MRGRHRWRFIIHNSEFGMRNSELLCPCRDEFKMICRGRLWRSFCYIMANIKAQQKGRTLCAPTFFSFDDFRADNIRPYKMFVFQQFRIPNSAFRILHYELRITNYALSDRSLMTSPAIISPTTDGTKAFEPGVERRDADFSLSFTQSS